MISPVKIWRRQKEIMEILGKRGKIVTWTTIFVAPEEFKKRAPYPVIIVEFDDMKRAVGQLVDHDSKKDLVIGRKVIAILRKTKQGSSEDVIAYGIKFKPV